MNALLLVDIQNDFLPGGALAVSHGDEIVAVANRLMPKFEIVVATQDWHPRNHGSFAANHPDAKVGDVIQLNGLKQILWPVHCVQGTTGADFSGDLDVRRIQRVFHKGEDPHVDSYSGFFDNGRRNSGLEDYLRELGVEAVFVMGLATDYCVAFTAMDAQELAFQTHVVLDGCRGVDLRPGDIDATVAQMSNAGIRIVQSDELA